MGLYAQRTGNTPTTKKWEFDGWPRGQNSYAEPNETRDSEYYEGVNIELVGRASIRLPRRGHRLFTTVTSSTVFNGWGIYKDPTDGTNLMLAMYNGHLYKISTAGVVTEIDNSVTWDENAKMRGVLLQGWYYFGNGEDYLSKTDGTTVVQWDAVTAVTGVGIALTGSGSDALYDYLVTAVTETGETEISNEPTATFGPATLDTSNYFTITWNRKTDSNVKGYNIYKSYKGGTYRLFTFVDQATSGGTQSTTDKGGSTSLIYEAPSFNTTGGVKGNIYAKYANTLFISGNSDQPDTVFYGGTGANYESFSPSDNGGWVKPGRGDGDKVTNIIGFEDFLFIFKENSIWKFVFAGDGGPELTAVIPQYGTSSPDCVWRMERDVAFLGTDGRYRILGYEPTQLNVIRTTDISNRIQNKIDAIDKSDPTDIVGIFFDQKYIVCDGSVAYPYDRRYVAFIGEWDNYTFERFLVWDQGTGQQKCFAAEADGSIQQILVDGTYDDNGTSIDASFRPKTIDAGEDKLIKYYRDSRFKLKDAHGAITFETYLDDGLLSADVTSFGSASPVFDEFMFDEAMWDEDTAEQATDTRIKLVKKEIYEEAYYLHHIVKLSGNESTHAILQTASGYFDFEDPEHARDEIIL